MKRAFLLPVIAASLLLAGCVYDYTYRGAGPGDYYYGRPSVDYRYYGGYGGYGYGGYYGGYYGGFYPYGYYRYGYPYGRYGYGYPYSYPYGYYPHRQYYQYPNRHYRPYQPPVHHDRDRDNQHRSDRAPWRDFGRFPRQQPGQGPSPNMVQSPNVAQPRAVMPPRPATEARREGGVSGTMRRMVEPRHSEAVQQQTP